MAKTYENTKEHHIKTIRYVLKTGPAARFKFNGTLFDFTHWIASRWNKEHPDDKITRKDVGLTPEIEKKLKSVHFLPKEDDGVKMICLNTYRPPYQSLIMKRSPAYEEEK